MRFLGLLAICGIGAAITAAVPRPVGDTSIVDPEAKFELLYTRSAPVSGGLTEGPAVAHLLFRYSRRERQGLNCSLRSQEQKDLRFYGRQRQVQWP
jgi:hypothetical protein